jgi:hypothetical protein
MGHLIFFPNFYASALSKVLEQKFSGLDYEDRLKEVMIRSQPVKLFSVSPTYE